MSARDDAANQAKVEAHRKRNEERIAAFKREKAQSQARVRASIEHSAQHPRQIDRDFPMRQADQRRASEATRDAETRRQLRDLSAGMARSRGEGMGR